MTNNLQKTINLSPDAEYIIGTLPGSAGGTLYARVASTVNIASLTGTLVIDGVTTVAGDKVLIKDQTAGAANGLYIAAAGAWNRTLEFDASTDIISGMSVYVSEGTVNGGTGWKLSTIAPIILGTTALAFVNIAGTSGSVGGDATGILANMQVIGLTGTAGIIAMHGTTITYDTGVVAPTIKQANNTANNVAAQSLLIQAANATGTTSIGGNLNLTSGTGTQAAGVVTLQTGGVTRLSANPSGTISINNLGTGIVHADVVGALTSSKIIDADVATGANIAVTKLAAGTNGFTLQIVGGVPTWATPPAGAVTLAGDASGLSSSNIVTNLTGTTGTVTSAATTIQFNNGLIPIIKQANNTTANGAGSDFTIQAANATGTGSTLGGGLILTSGTGTTFSGAVIIKTGGTTRLTINPSGNVLIPDLNANGVVHSSTPLGQLTSSLVVNADISNSAAIAVSKLATSTNGFTLQIVGGVPTWVAASGSVTLAGDVTGPSGSNIVVGLTGTAGTVVSAANIIQFNNGLSSPTIKQANNTTNNVAASTMTIQAANATGTTSNGGNLNLTSGTGTTAAGVVTLQTGGVIRLSANPSGTISINNLGTGIVHADVVGALTSSLVVNADISNAAAIAVSKLASSINGNVLQVNSGVPTWTLPTSLGLVPDTRTLTGTAPIQIDGVNTPVPFSLNRTISILSATTAALGSIKLANDLGGTALLPTVISLTGSGGQVLVKVSNLVWDSLTSPVLTQPISTTNGRNFSILAQSGTASGDTAGGNIILGGGGTHGLGLGGGVQLAVGDVTGQGTVIMLETKEVVHGKYVLSLNHLTPTSTAATGSNPGSLVVFVNNCFSEPRTNPVTGAILYSTNGGIKYKRTDGIRVN